ncbi:MAG: Ppx/GppA family phosphatase [Pseudomonadota bacterium]
MGEAAILGPGAASGARAWSSVFDGTNAHALARVGVIDIGSNSVRMVVFDGAARSPAYYFNEKLLCGLGAGFAETGRLNPEGRDRAMKEIARFVALARGMDVAPLIAVATAAVRDASDGPSFRAEVEAATGLRLRVVDGAEEARLSAQGVLLGWPGAAGLVCDIGGSSLELAELSGDGQIGTCRTSDLGPLKLMGISGGSRAIDKHIAGRVAALRQDFDAAADRLFLVGGSWRAIARVDMERRGYPLRVLHEYRMTPEALGETIDLIGSSDVADLRAMTGASEARMRLVPLAAKVLRRIVRDFRPADISVSSYGIREGLLYEQMSEALRHRDPLIEAARHAEATNARMPGFGHALFEFVSPLFVRASPARMRLVHAACLLHDVSWRAHPDYRAEVCFDNATRANLGGLTHEERVFLGLALLHRYKSSRRGTNFAPLLTLLTETQIRDAEVLGRAMRFGAMFAGTDPSTHGTLALDPEGPTLRLELRTREGQALFGEVTEARFNALAGAMGAETEVRHAAL